MFAKAPIVVCAAVLAVVLGFAATALIPGPHTPIGLLGSAFGSPASASQSVETVEGKVSGYKYSPSGRHIDGFYLDGNGFLPGQTAVSLPPHAASLMPREGSSVEVSGMSHTNPLGEEAIHAMSITDNETGRTLGIEDPAMIAVPPSGDPGFGPADLKGKGAKGAAPPPVG